jgi:hypothetical protein
MKIDLDATQILNLDLTPATPTIDSWLDKGDLSKFDLNLEFAIDYPREPEDPRELPEIPEIRLWFIRLDARYPWLPLGLNWQNGELARYVAMLVPHQFSSKDGIVYNPEALEIWTMNKVFYLTDWLRERNISDRHRLKFMTQMFGYEIDDGLFDLLK